MTVTNEHLGREVWAVRDDGRLQPGVLRGIEGAFAYLELDYMYLAAHMADRVYPTREEAARHV